MDAAGKGFSCFGIHDVELKFPTTGDRDHLARKECNQQYGDRYSDGSAGP